MSFFPSFIDFVLFFSLKSMIFFPHLKRYILPLLFLTKFCMRSLYDLSLKYGLSN